MNPTPAIPLSGSHLRTYNAIFRHPISHNLEWRAVHSLLVHLGQLVVEPNGNFKATRNGKTLILHAPRTKDVTEADEVMALRRFLELSDAAPAEATESNNHWLLVIDHKEARIYRTEMAGNVPQRIFPHEPSEHFRHAHNSKDFTRGRDKPDPSSFFGPVAKAMLAKGPILIFGSGTGTSSEMIQFIAWLNVHHPELARRIVGSLVVDEHHLTEGQLLGRAREFYANLRA